MQLPQCLGLSWRRCAYSSLPSWCTTACHGGSCDDFGNVGSVGSGRHDHDDGSCLSRVGVAMGVVVACPICASLLAPQRMEPGMTLKNGRYMQRLVLRIFPYPCVHPHLLTWSTWTIFFSYP